MKENKKALMLWTGNDNSEMGGVGYYRIVSPAQKLQKLGYNIDIVSGWDVVNKFNIKKHDNELIDVYSNILETYDLLWMKHTDNKDAIAAIFSLKDQFKCKVVWDFDDDLFNVRESQPAYKEYHPGSDRRAIVASAMSYCDAITVSTEYLKKSLSNLLKKVYNVDKDIYVCPNFVNPEEWNKIKYYPSNSPVIGYYGSTTHNDDFEMIKPIIYRILEKYPRVKFEIMGAFSSTQTIELFRDCPNVDLLKRVKLNGGTKGWKGFPELLLRQKWDIALAPLVDDEFNRSKSNIKWMETAMKSIPCVCSEVEPYKTTIIPGTGFMCNEEEDWFATLSTLIENPDVRVAIGKRAKEYVLSEFTDKKVKIWEGTLCELLK